MFFLVNRHAGFGLKTKNHIIPLDCHLRFFCITRIVELFRHWLFLFSNDEETFTWLRWIILPNKPGGSCFLCSAGGLLITGKLLLCRNLSALHPLWNDGISVQKVRLILFVYSFNVLLIQKVNSISLHTNSLSTHCVSLDRSFSADEVLQLLDRFHNLEMLVLSSFQHVSNVWDSSIHHLF